MASSKAKVTAKWNDGNITNAMRELSRLSGIDYKDVIRGEFKAAAEKAASWTKVATAESVKRSLYKQEAVYLPSSAYTPIRPRSSLIIYDDGSIRYAKRLKYPNALWSKIRSERDRILRKQSKKEGTTLEALLIARGLQRKAWKQMGRDIGLNINISGVANKATTPEGDYPQNNTARQFGNGAKFEIHGTIRRTYDRRIFSIARSALKGRASFFKRNLRNGVFNDAKQIAAKYPGLTITR